MGRAAALIAAATLCGCSPPGMTTPLVAVATPSGAAGTLVLGITERNYVDQYGRSTQGLSVRFRGDTGQDLVVARQGCALREAAAPLSCTLSRPGEQASQVRPGTYTMVSALEQDAVFDSTRTVAQPIPNGPSVTVAAGEVVDAGVFAFATEFGTDTIRLVGHRRDPTQAAASLDGAPALRDRLVYRGPLPR